MVKGFWKNNSLRSVKELTDYHTALDHKVGNFTGGVYIGDLRPGVDSSGGDDGIAMVRCGFGEFWYANGKRYVGGWINGVQYGEGELFNRKGQLEMKGFFVANGKISGKGCLYYLTADEIGPKKYDGFLMDGRPCGMGKWYHENGQLKFVGRTENGCYSGTGKLYNNNGELYLTADFSARGEIETVRSTPGGKFGPELCVQYLEKLIYVGALGSPESQVKSGKGVLYCYNGTKYFEGNFEGDKIQGYGITYYENGSKWYMGYWNNGVYFGKGVLYRKDGTKIYQGYWKNDKYDGHGMKFGLDGDVMACGLFEENFLIRFEENSNLKGGKGYQVRYSETEIYFGQVCEAWAEVGLELEDRHVSF